MGGVAGDVPHGGSIVEVPESWQRPMRPRKDPSGSGGAEQRLRDGRATDAARHPSGPARSRCPELRRRRRCGRGARTGRRAWRRTGSSRRGRRPGHPRAAGRRRARRPWTPRPRGSARSPAWPAGACRGRRSPPSPCPPASVRRRGRARSAPGRRTDPTEDRCRAAGLPRPRGRGPRVSGPARARGTTCPSRTRAGRRASVSSISASSARTSGSSGSRSTIDRVSRIASADTSTRSRASPEDAAYPSLNIRYSTPSTPSTRSAQTSGGGTR